MTTSTTSPARTIAQILTDGKAEYLGYDFRARAHRRRGKPFDVAVAEKNLLTLKEILEQHGVTLWLVFGTCLGAVRDGGFIPHDTDTDIGVFAHDKEKVIAAIPDLVKAGLIPIRTKQPDDLLTFMREDEYIDIGFFGKFRDAEGFDYWCYQQNRVYGDHFDKFGEIRFLNTTFRVPHRVEAYLASLYGAGWKTPVKNLPAKEPTSHREFKPFSNLLALGDFFRGMPAHAVLKLSENFPSYHDYSDIDILCADRAAVLAHILAVAREYEGRGFTIKQVEHQGHLHVDFHAPGAKKLNVRFDLLATLDAYQKLAVSPDFAAAVIAGRSDKTQNGATVQVPALAHDLALRFMEFIEFREARPDKIKHWEFIQKTGNYDFVEVINRFTDLKVTLAREAGTVKLSWARQSAPAPATPTAANPTEIAARQTPFLQAAVAEFAAQRYAEAAEQYCAAFELGPDTSAVLSGLGACLIELQDLASAHRCVARLAALEPANTVAAQARDQLAGVCGAAEVTGGVAELLASTLAFCNDCINRQDLAAALQALGRAIRLDPRNAGTRVFRGQLSLVLNDAEAAVKDFAEALKLDARCAGAHAGLARLFLRAENLPEAEQAAGRALALNATEEEALQVKAECTARRLAARVGADGDLGALFTELFSVRSNGMFVACAPAGAADATQVLVERGWKGFHLDPSVAHSPAAELRPALAKRRVETAFEVLSVVLEAGECSLLAASELAHWRPQLIVIDRPQAATGAGEDPYSNEYFAENQYFRIYAQGGRSVYAARGKLVARRTRMDCFLIWGHGIPHWENILERMRARPDLEIVAIHRRPTGDMTKFVQDLYACDTVPFEHLRAKTRYLLTIPSEVIVVLVRNHNTQEKYYGEGAFRHIQCALVKDLKEEVRNAWNPRVGAKRSEDHVIHATDYDSQVVHTLKMLGLPALETYQRQPNPAYDLPYHLGVAKYREIEIPLDRIRARILGLGVVPIEQTPHSRFVAGERAPYQEYYARHAGKELNDDHTAGAFDRLIKDFDYGRPGRNGKPGLLAVSRQGDFYLLLDGVHRAAILKHQGRATVRVLEMLPIAGAAPVAKAPASVVVKLMGGLGNQMFQYAAGLAVARKNGVPLQLDLSFLQDRTPRVNITPRNYALDIFPLQPGCELLTSAQALPAGVKPVAEKHFHHDPAVAELGGGVHLQGYWQSPRYFAAIDAEVRKSFALAPSLGAEAAAVAARIADSDAVCVHVRRGDMVHNPHAAAMHGSCPAEYYRTACALITARHPSAHFFIFSDDPQWCESQDLTSGRPQTIVSRAGGTDSPATDLFLMRQCRHFVIANSSFSWWAAYLGEYAGKMVIFPDPWFLDPSTDTSDLFPKEWIRWSRRPGPASQATDSAPLVSIVMPCYKQAHFLQEAIESVVAQTMPDWELIVVNDGSPDETSRVTQDLIARHPGRRIRLLEKANGGLASARNAGIAVAAGRFILPLDSDDRLDPRMLEKTRRVLDQQPELAIAYVDQLHFSAERQQVRVIEYDFTTLKRSNFLAYCSLYRKEVWTKNGGYKTDVPGYEDWDFWITAGENGFKAKRVPELLFHYRRRTGSMLAAAKSLEHELRSQIILHHPKLFNAQERAWAAGVGGTKRGTVEKIMGSGSGGAVAPTAAPAFEALRGRRVLIYTDDPGQGGAAHYNHALLGALLEAGAVALCAQPKGDGKLTTEQAARGVQHCWTSYNPVVEFGRSFVDEDDARRIFGEAKPDVIYFSDCCALSHIAAKKVAISLQVPFVVICHSEAKYLAQRFAQFLPTVKTQLAQASAVIGVSKSSLGVLHQYFGLAADKGQVIYNGAAEGYFAPVDATVRARLRAELKLPDDAVLCFTAARLDAGKSHQIQLEAIRRLRDSGRLGSLHFAWAGDGDLRKPLEQAIQKHQLGDRVHLLGYRWDVRDLMGAADVFVLTTLYEAMPLCILEAMARGLPVVASAVGGIPEELGETGILLPDPNVSVAKTVATLMDALTGLAESAHRRQALGATAKKRAVELFSGVGMLRATLGVIQQALVSRAAAPTPEEFFGADEVRTIEQLCTAYARNPADPTVAAQMHGLRQGLMSFLVTAPVAQLEALFKGGFGRVFRALTKSGLPSESPTAEITEQVAVLDEALAGGLVMAAGFDVRPLLARMLCAPAHRGSARISPDRIPAWWLEDYLGYVLQAPQVFIRAGEAEEYQAHLQGWMQDVLHSTRTAPDAPLTLTVAGRFALQVNFIPAYFSTGNLRELAEQRAAIMEFFLRKQGAAIDAKLPRRPKDRRRIKVGFINAHFGAQTETHVTLPTLQLDRERFEVCLFAVHRNAGPVEDYCRAQADSLTVLPSGLGQQVKLLREAALDIAIIGTNITAVTNHVALIALHRLAPVQLASYCSPISTGMRNIDGYLSGTFTDCAGLQEHFSEKLRFCEGPPGCLDYTVEAPAKTGAYDRARLGLAPDDVVFLNAAACFKILPEMQETWAKILAAVPRSKLVLLPFNPNWTSNFPVKQFDRTLTEILARHGVDRSRVVLVDSLPTRADVKALEQVADVYLDTAPFSGSISVIDPLEIGLPPVIQQGTTHRSRMAAALVRELQIPELITDSEAGYRALAVKLGTEPAFRAQLKARILAAMAQRPKFVHAPTYAADLGRLLETLVPQGRKIPGELTAA